MLNVTLARKTGFRDKNNHEIKEGDWLVNPYGVVDQVVWDKERARFKFRLSGDLFPDRKAARLYKIIDKPAKYRRKR